MTSVVEYHFMVKFVFSKKATKIDRRFDTYYVKLKVKILSIFVAFLGNIHVLRKQVFGIFELGPHPIYP